jgi:hypothetical protein
MKRTTLAISILAFSTAVTAAETPTAAYNGADQTTATLAQQPNAIPVVGEDIADGAGTIQSGFFADNAPAPLDPLPTPAAAVRDGANTIADQLITNAPEQIPAATGDTALATLIGDGVFGAASAAIAIPAALQAAAADQDPMIAVDAVAAVPLALVAGLTAAGGALGLPDVPGLTDEEEPEPQPVSEQIGQVVISATGTAPAAEEACSVSATPVAFDFGSALTYATSTTRALGDAPITVSCGADRAAAATVFLSTSDVTDPSAATSAVAGSVGAVSTTFTIVNAGATPAEDTLIGSVSSGTTAPGESADFELAATYDKTAVKDGGAISFDASATIYVVIQ